MRTIKLVCSIALALLTVGAGRSVAATSGRLGTVVSIPGTPSDIVLDESRGVLYIANFGSGTIDVMTLADNTIHSSINVAAFPVGIAMSPSGAYLVAVHYDNLASTSSSSTSTTTTVGGGNLITIINLNSRQQTTLALGSAPLGVTFVNTQVGDQGGLAVIATTTDILLLDPATQEIKVLTTLAEVALSIPQTAPALPAFFTEAAVGTSGDGFTAWGVFGAGTGSQLMFSYNALTSRFYGGGWTTTIPLMPRVAVSWDGTTAMLGYAQFKYNVNTLIFNMVAAYPNAVAATGAFANVTGMAWDSAPGHNNMLYAQIPDLAQGTQPALVAMDADNLAYEDRYNLPENLVGRAVLNKAATLMYAMSTSGVTLIPVGAGLNATNRLQPSQEDVLIQTSFCNQTQATQTFTLADPGGNATPFSITSSNPGIRVSPVSGVTPATISVTAAPSAFTATKGTTVASLAFSSATAVNQPIPVRVLVNNPDVDQRGTVVNVPGVLSDILPDSGRNRFYILRQDRNKVLVFDAGSNSLMTSLRTATTPAGMAMAPDPYTGKANKYLLVANADSQLVTVIDLDALTVGSPIVLPFSDFGRSIAVANNAILALSFDGATQVGDVSTLSLLTGAGTSLTSLGPWSNDIGWISPLSVLTASPNGASVLMAGPDGHVSLYDADRGTFITSRQDLKALAGAYAASSYKYYVVGDNVLNSALVSIGKLGDPSGNSSGFAFVDTDGASGYFATGPAIGSGLPGAMQYFDPVAPGLSSPIPTVESPLLPSTISYPSQDGTVSNNGSGSNSTSQQRAFTRTVAPLTGSGEIVELSTSGFTVLGKGYASAFQSPILTSITNAADYSAKVAPDGLVSVWGTGMSATSIVASQIPLPTSLGESCLSVAGTPIPLVFVSATQINAQLPYNVIGSESINLHTPGGVSNTLNFTVNPTAPAVFLSGVAGDWTGLATVFRYGNGQIVTPTNAVRINDTLVVWLTGMGQTSPEVLEGQPAPTDPLAYASSQPTVTLGGYKLIVDYAGMAPGLPGVYQINVKVPFGVPTGADQPLVITQGAGKTTLNFRVVTN
jgi:uncharacterized protein (TIGR03437 family)